MHLPPFKGILAFDAVARLGSSSKAAEELSPSSYALTFDRTYMVLDAATQGLGIALDSDRMAGNALKRGDRVVKFTQLLRDEVAKEA